MLTAILTAIEWVPVVGVVAIAILENRPRKRPYKS